MKILLYVLKKIFLLIFVPIMVVACFVRPLAEKGFAANIGNSTGNIWGEKIGYISMGGGVATPDYGVTVTASGLSGYAWSEQFGWINFDDAGANYAVTNDGDGNLSGYAWSEKTGYISFDDQSVNDYYQVTIDEHGTFSGYAWSEKLGYINFNDSGSLYETTTTWALPDVTTNAATSILDNSFTGNGDITEVHGTTVTTRGFKYALSISSGTCDTWDVHEDGSYGVESFDLPITGLNTNTAYYYRAYATNDRGTAYGTCTAVGTTKAVSPVILRKNVQLRKNIKIK